MAIWERRGEDGGFFKGKEGTRRVLNGGSESGKSGTAIELSGEGGRVTRIAKREKSRRNKAPKPFSKVLK